MSDAVWIALITGPVTILLTHLLGRRDRALASETVKAKDAEMVELKAAHREEIEDYQETIARLTRRLLDLGVTP